MLLLESLLKLNLKAEKSLMCNLSIVTSSDSCGFIECCSICCG